LEEVAQGVNEFLMALWTMTASHYQWEMPSKQPVPIVQPVEELQTLPELTGGERLELRKALRRIARCSTGRMIQDSSFGWFVPAQKPRCH
jgi:hypothetical protein